jgi:hypothetical protein
MRVQFRQDLWGSGIRFRRSAPSQSAIGKVARRMDNGGSDEYRRHCRPMRQLPQDDSLTQAGSLDRRTQGDHPRRYLSVLPVRLRAL